jgi:hypothetical protein
MNWTQIPCIVQKMKTWYTEASGFQYIKSHDEIFNIWGASAKPLGRPDTRLIDLGDEHPTEAEAEAAIEVHILRHRQ